MTTNKLPQWLSLGLAFPLIVLNAWVLLQVVQYFQPLVSILVAALLLAFVLDYPIRFFQKQGINRNFAIVSVLLLAVVIVGALAITLVPLILEQLNELINFLPKWIDSGIQQVQAFQTWIATQSVTQEFPVNLSSLLTQVLDRFSNQLQSFTGQILGFAVDTIGSLVNVLVTVVITIYLILNGEKLWNGIFQWFPSHISLPVRQLLREDFQNYFIGQAILGALLAIILIFIFLALQIPLALLFGIGIGFFSLFPFGTGIGIAIVTLLIGLQNFWLGVEVLTVSVLVDQVNTNFVAPRLLGNLTGLNPVWVVISLLIGAKLGGLLGLLVAIPIASFIKDVVDSWRDGGFRVPLSDNVSSDGITSEKAANVVVER